MLAVVAIAVAALIALAVLGGVAHLLLSPWLLVAIGIVAWAKFRPRRSQR